MLRAVTRLEARLGLARAEALARRDAEQRARDLDVEQRR